MYKLLGTAGAPLVAGTLTRIITAKLAETMSLAVCNPLSFSQRYHVQIELKEVHPATMLNLSSIVLGV